MMKLKQPPLEQLLRDVEVSNKRVMELAQRLASITKEIQAAKQELARLTSKTAHEAAGAR